MRWMVGTAMVALALAGPACTSNSGGESPGLVCGTATHEQSGRCVADDGGAEGVDGRQEDGGTTPPTRDAGAVDGSDESAVDDAAHSPDALDDSVTDTGVDTGAGDALEGGAFDGDADAVDTGGGADDAPVDQAIDVPVSYTCGDGVRGPTTEECDDGLGNTPGDRACDPSCVVQDRLAATGEADSRWLASSPHAIAAGPSGHAVALMEMLPLDAGGDVRVIVAVFSANGERLGVAHVPDVPLESDPVIAASPDGSFALALASIAVDGDGLGIAIYRVSADGGLVTLVGSANTTSLYGQHSPDITWDGQRMVVSWSDDSPPWGFDASGRRHCRRGYTSELIAIDAMEVLAGRNGVVVRAWREESPPGDDSAEYLVVGAAGWTARYGMATAPPVSDSPAVGWLYDDTILVVHSDGTGSLLGVVLASDGSPIWGPEPILAAGSIGFQPSLAATQDGVYMAWAAPSTVDDAGALWGATPDETWIRKLVWTGAGFDSSAEPLPLPRHAAHQAGDQTRPMLGTWHHSSTVLAASWNDLALTNYAASAPHGDVALELIPTPILRGPAQ